MGILDRYEPKAVWKYFEEICGIPHGSGDTSQIAGYFEKFAGQHGFEFHKDAAGNVIIIKEASSGYENVPALILQGHMDMVCEKTPETKIDFLTDGLTLVPDGDFVTAEGTTLGGDDGIAAAYGLALLSDETLSHPRLELVLTVDEEVGLLGAAALDVSPLKGRNLINLDSEDEGVFLAGCAGGLTLTCEVPVTREESEGVLFDLDFSGFKGGHSGDDIDKGRANSNMAAARVLFEAGHDVPLRIVSISGGTKDNAIPRRTAASVIIGQGQEEAFCRMIMKEETILRDEYAGSDGNITVTATERGTAAMQVLSGKSQDIVLDTLMNIPDGIQKMSADIPDLVETSQNMGIMRLDDDALRMSFSVRSSRESAKHYLAGRTEEFIRLKGGSSARAGDYPGWTYQKDSKLCDSFAESYERLFGKKPQMKAIHAGVECGILKEKLCGADCISLGPQMYDIHTTEERLSISSVEKCYRLIRDVIEKKD